MEPINKEYNTAQSQKPQEPCYGREHHAMPP